MKVLTLMLAAVSLLGWSTSAAAGGVRWTLSHFAMGKKALILSEEKEPVSLRSGWTCEVGALSDGSSYEARTTTCKKGEEQFSFVVQCDQNRTKDHTQVMLKSGTKDDYIEVLCEPR